MKIWGVVASLCLAFSLTVRAQEGTNAPAHPPGQHHGGAGLGHGGFGNGEHGGEMRDFMGKNRETEKAFRESLKDMPEDQRQAAVQKHRQEMAGKMKATAKEQFEKMKEHIQSNPRLSAEQKQEILSHMEQQFKATAEFMQGLHQKMQAEREKIMQDSSLNEEQKRAAMKKAMEGLREEMKKHREQMEAQRKTMQEKYRDLLGRKPISRIRPNPVPSDHQSVPRGGSSKPWNTAVS